MAMTIALTPFIFEFLSMFSRGMCAVLTNSHSPSLPSILCKYGHLVENSVDENGQRRGKRRSFSGRGNA